MDIIINSLKSFFDALGWDGGMLLFQQILWGIGAICLVIAIMGTVSYVFNIQNTRSDNKKNFLMHARFIGLLIIVWFLGLTLIDVKIIEKKRHHSTTYQDALKEKMEK